MGCLSRNEIASLGITEAVCSVGSRLRPVAISNAHGGSEVMLGLAHIIMKGVQHVSDR
jgi:hypothetical protein